MKALGCFGLLALLSWLALETYVYLLVAGYLNTHHGASLGTAGWWLPMLWILAALVVGIKLAKRHVTQIVAGILTGTAGRHVVGALGAVLLAIPGLLTDLPGLLLLLPPVQIGLGKLGNKIVSSIVKQVMGRMMGGGGGLGGFPFPGGFGAKSPFPGMMPKADDRIPFKKPGKIIDTTVER